MIIKNYTLLLILLIPFKLLANTPKLIWSDEFEKAGLPDQSKWGYEVGYVRNGELQLYQENNAKTARVEGGYLIIEAHRKLDDNQLGFFEQLFAPKSKDVYESASVTTKGLSSWIYGRIDVRAKLPKGRGVWPAIWMLGDDCGKIGWPLCGEVDIMEFVGYAPGKVHSAIHTANRNHRLNNHISHSVEQESFIDDFHIYSVDKRSNRIDFYIDNVKHFTYIKENDDVKSWPFDKPMYLLLNLAIGGGWGGQKGVDNNIFPQKFIIDYVRVYE